jgi:hypothetical protein
MQLVPAGSNPWIGPIFNSSSLLPANGTSVPWNTIAVNGVFLTATGNVPSALLASGRAQLSSIPSSGATALVSALAAVGTFMLDVQLGVGYTPYGEQIIIGGIPAIDAAPSTANPVGTAALANAGVVVLTSTVLSVQGTQQITTNIAYSSLTADELNALAGSTLRIGTTSYSIAGFGNNSGKLQLNLQSAFTAPPSGALTISNLATGPALFQPISNLPTLPQLIDQTGTNGSDGSPHQTIGGAVLNVATLTSLVPPLTVTGAISPAGYATTFSCVGINAATQSANYQSPDLSMSLFMLAGGNWYLCPSNSYSIPTSAPTNGWCNSAGLSNTPYGLSLTPIGTGFTGTASCSQAVVSSTPQTVASGTVAAAVAHKAKWAGFTTTGYTGSIPGAGVVTVGGIQHLYTCKVVGSTATFTFSAYASIQPAVGAAWSVSPKVYVANPTKATVLNVSS